MANVPYSPVPNVAPTVPGLPRVGIDTPPAAFGAATAAAVRGLGQQTEQSSNQMFQTALDVQTLRNDTWSKNDFVNKSAQIGEVENKLYSLKGQEAVDFAPEANRQIRQIYQDAIAKAPNPQAARMLGDQLSRRIAYSLVDIGRHSGNEQLRAAGDASASTMAVGLDLVSKSPWNEDLFNSYTKDGGLIDQEAANLGRLGFGKAEANSIKLKNQYWEARFEALYGKPDQAQILYNQHENDIPPEARQKILQNIRSSDSTTKFLQSYSTSLNKAKDEAAVSEISSRNRIIDPATGQAGYGPNATQELLDYNKTHPGSDKEVRERLGWIRQANEDAAKGMVIQTKPEVLSALTGNMFNYPNPTSERDLARAENDRGLSTKDREWIQNVIKLRDSSDKEVTSNPSFKIAMDWAKNEIVSPNNLAAFQYEFLTKYNQALQDRTLKANDLDIRNEKGLFRQVASQYSQSLTNDLRATAPPQIIPTVVTKQQYDALPPGTDFNDSKGRKFTKPAAVPASQPGEQ